MKNQIKIILYQKNGRKFWHAITWMNLKDVMLSEINQSQKDK